MPFPNSTVAQARRFTNIRPIGRGSGGQVYAAVDNIGRTVAIKEALPSARDFMERRIRFEREAQIQGALTHPNIIAVHYLEEDPQSHELYLVCEYANGGSLAEHIRDHGRLPEQTAIKVAIDICTALEMTSSQHIVHRDIKPGNILLFKDQQGQIVTAKLADFGIARDNKQRPTTILAGMAHAGTWQYMPPEQGDITRPVDVRTDLYALGITLWEMLTTEDYKVLRAQTGTTPNLRAYNPHTSDGIDHIIQRAVPDDPQQRYQQAGLMIRDLEDVRTGKFTAQATIQYSRPASPSTPIPSTHYPRPADPSAPVPSAQYSGPTNPSLPTLSKRTGRWGGFALAIFVVAGLLIAWGMFGSAFGQTGQADPPATDAPESGIVSGNSTVATPPSDPTEEATLAPSAALPSPTDAAQPTAEPPTEQPPPTATPEPPTEQPPPTATPVPPTEIPTEPPVSGTCLEGFVWRMAGPDDKTCVTEAAYAQAQQDNAAAESRLAAADAVYGPDTCKQGYVWRGARPEDHVCVTGDVRDQAAADNAAADSRKLLEYGPDTCKQGYVWRGARPEDHVCVTPDVRSQAAEDNAAADSRREPEGGAYGPDTCIQGYVWREAFEGDHVCVTGDVRSQAAADNAAAASRLAAADAAYGPDTCKQGYVWREAFDDDHVCVTGDVRDQAAADNAAADSRKLLEYGPDTCKQGYVWREAFDDDHVCVTPDVRDQAQQDNHLAASRTVP